LGTICSDFDDPRGQIQPKGQQETEKVADMRLLKTTGESLELKKFFSKSIPPYAILSHTWGDEEVTFQEMQNLDNSIPSRKGYAKIQNAANKSLEDGLSYVWVDSYSCLLV
jgi:hypothetical protein